MKLFPLALAGCIALVAGCQDGPRSGPATNATSASAVMDLAPPYLTNAQPRLQTMKLFVGPEELSTELALKPLEIFTGMMWRTNMPEGTAMLFVFPDASPRAFYMRNTYVPLSLAYIDPEGVIQEIHDLQPLKEESVPSMAENIQFVLEVPQGWFKRHNVTPGMLIRTPLGEMKKTFTFHRP